MRRVAGYAPQFDEVLVDATSVGRPYIFLLAAEALPPAEAQAEPLGGRGTRWGTGSTSHSPMPSSKK